MKISCALALFSPLATLLPVVVQGQWVWDMNCSACDKGYCRWWDLVCQGCLTTANFGRNLLARGHDPCEAENIVWGAAANQWIVDAKNKLVELGIVNQSLADSVDVRWCRSLDKSLPGTKGLCTREDLIWMHDSFLQGSFKRFLFVLVHEFVHPTQWAEARQGGLNENEIFCTFGESGIENSLNQDPCGGIIEAPACAAACAAAAAHPNELDAGTDCATNFGAKQKSESKRIRHKHKQKSGSKRIRHKHLLHQQTNKRAK